MNILKIKLEWDEEASVWVATSDDVKGLVLEDESFDELVREVQLAVPTLLALNSTINSDIILSFYAYRQERLSQSG
ncbi:MAG: DUF1902 domain-containing protein [Oscillospiraceae bacterium]|nr:DUF1902 domain-containing protein [Oscillospiraceae bacterium]